MTNDQLEQLTYGHRRRNDDVTYRRCIAHPVLKTIHIQTYLEIMYYFFNKKNKCIGCMNEMPNDFHIFILPQYRRKGVALKAMKLILPYILRRRKALGLKQFTAHSSTKASFDLLQKLGFTPVEGYNYSDYDIEPNEFFPILHSIIIE